MGGGTLPLITLYLIIHHISIYFKPEFFHFGFFYIDNIIE